MSYNQRKIFRVMMMDKETEEENQELTLYYKGPFDQTVLSKIGNFVKEKFKDLPKVRGKLFSIFIELAQNISYYSHEVNFNSDISEKKRVGIVAIYENESHIIFKAGNLTKKTTFNDIALKCQMINKLNFDELRAFKRLLLNTPRKQNHEGGNIGLIQVALKADEPLVINYSKTDTDFCYFTITTQVKKQLPIN